MTDDTARCPGSGSEGEWREGCEDCAHRLAPRPDTATWIEPPPIIAFWCEYHIPMDGSRAQATKLQDN